jgi:futalosine hydrolase
MSFRILFVAATKNEADIVSRISGCDPADGRYRTGDFELDVLVTGVGAMSTAWELQKWIYECGRPDLAINIGIAGSYRNEISLGDVVMPVTDCFGDSGIEDSDSFMTLFEAALALPDEFPFKKGVIPVFNGKTEMLGNYVKPVAAVTVNTATGAERSRDRLLFKFNPDIETMEGAVFFYICSRERIPFLAFRSISNMVGKRDKKMWNIKLALNNLATKLDELFLKMI